MKITKGILRTKVSILNPHLPVTLFLEFGNNNARLCKQSSNGIVVVVSPRVGITEMANIIDTLYITTIAIEQD